MKNPATTIPFNELNCFTQFIVDNPGTLVQLRNGDTVKPILYTIQHSTEEAHFYMPGNRGGYRWYLCGKAIKNRTFDMMLILEGN